MSRNHNRPEKFMHDFMDIFRKYSIPSNLIQVEILERSVMDNTTLQDITEKLHKEGFTVAMDDFGSGQSSLNMLTKIPIDYLPALWYDVSVEQSKEKNREKDAITLLRACSGDFFCISWHDQSEISVIIPVIIQAEILWQKRFLCVISGNEKT